MSGAEDPSRAAPAAADAAGTGRVRTRAARPDDAALVRDLILELAEYERLADRARAGEADVRRLLFGPRPWARCEIVEVDGAPEGFALWFYNVSTFEGREGMYLEDLYVRPAARGLGAGRALLARLAAICRDEGLPRMDWAVLTWNATAIGFYDRIGAETLEDWRVRRLSGEALAALGAEAPPED